MSKKPLKLTPVQQASQEAFYDARVMHAKMRAAMTSLETLLAAPSESVISLVVGATGVGKTTFAKVLTRRLGEAYAEEADADPTCIPVVVVQAYTSGESKPSFKDLFRDILSETNPLAHAALSISKADGRIWIGNDARDSVSALRRRVEAALRHRKVRVLVIDEAYHLCHYANSTAVLDTLKSIANTAGVRLVLIGSYDLHALIESHAQVARRTSLVLFERYDIKSAEDRMEWKRIVRALQVKWPCKYVPNFANISDALLESCLGCVGLLKSLLLEASALQLLNGGKWEVRFLQLSAKSVALRDVIRREIELGEMRVRESVRGNSLWDDKTLATLSAAMQSDAKLSHEARQ